MNRAEFKRWYGETRRMLREMAPEVDAYFKDHKDFGKLPDMIRRGYVDVPIARDMALRLNCFSVQIDRFAPIFPTSSSHRSEAFACLTSARRHRLAAAKRESHPWRFDAWGIAMGSAEANGRLAAEKGGLLP